MKPTLAKNWEPTKLAFPIGAQPKIDGVRLVHTDLGPTGRSLKPHKNRYTTKFYDMPEYRWLDGELAADDERHPDLCRITSSAVGTIAGDPFTLWHVFECLRKEILHAGYLDRYEYLQSYIAHEQSQGRCLHARVVPMQICKSMEEVLYWDALWSTPREDGLAYEGTILRNLTAPYKEGRSTINGAHLLRIKRFVHGEAKVESLEEGNSNENEAQVNELGRTFRSSHQENKVPNGTVGNMQCRMVGDVEFEGKVILKDGQPITVSPGKMDHPSRKRYWEHPDELVGHIIKFKFFPKGIKDKPRFPTYDSHRSKEDMSE